MGRSPDFGEGRQRLKIPLDAYLPRSGAEVFPGDYFTRHYFRIFHSSTFRPCRKSVVQFVHHTGKFNSKVLGEDFEADQHIDGIVYFQMLQVIQIGIRLRLSIIGSFKRYG